MSVTFFAKVRAIAPRAALVAGVLSVPFIPGSAQAFTVIPQPNASYVADTTLIDLSAVADDNTLASITQGSQTISFSQTMTKTTVPAGWASWGSPPATETSTPEVLYQQVSRVLDVTLSQAATIFGLEMQPDLFGSTTMKADFYNGSSLVGSITQLVAGQSGAKLFAADDAAGFTRVVLEEVSGNTYGFAVAQLRFGAEPANAVPGPLPLLGAAAAFRCSRRLRRRVNLGPAASSL
jgi:hypothetical protein